MTIDQSTPILIGAGQVADHGRGGDYRELSPVELAAEAIRAACIDATGTADIASKVDGLAVVRTVADSLPMFRKSLAPFGGPADFPASLAFRLKADLRWSVYSPACGDQPQMLVAEAARRLERGEFSLAVVCGAEAISTELRGRSEGKSLDWSEDHVGNTQDRGSCVGSVLTRHMMDSKLNGAPPVYALLEEARRMRLRKTAPDYLKDMAELFARFSSVAAHNPLSAKAEALDAATIGEANAQNRIITTPYTKYLVARDQVNLGAAVLMTTVAQAGALNIPQDKWVFLHGHAGAHELPVEVRPDLGTSPALKRTYVAALEAAGIAVEAIDFFDLYSCFPIAVFNALEALGLNSDDPRPLTLTGGLPFFGGPGNNYSLHGIAAAMDRVRAEPGTYALVGANGGMLSAHAVGIYSTVPAPFREADHAALQMQVDGSPQQTFTSQPNGAATIETYTIVHRKGAPAESIVVGRLWGEGARFFATSDDPETIGQLLSKDHFGAPIFVRADRPSNRFAFGASRLERAATTSILETPERLEHCKIEKRGRILEVTINRPEVRNALTPQANVELERIFDAFLEDPDLWVAILTGAGEQAFCTGNDLKYSASGKPVWVPLTGFAGLTSRAERNKPVICAVNGFAMGGGFEIALACDLVVADESARFALSEVKVGLIAGAGGIPRLLRQIPKKTAMELILTGRFLGAEEARSLGLVNRLAAPGKALQAARDLAEELLVNSPTSLAMSLEMANAQDQCASEVEACLIEYAAIDKLLTTEDMLEGISAFAEKRPPRWKNR